MIFIVIIFALISPFAIGELKPAGVPIFNYSSDYGFGFGAICALYDTSDDEQPYRRAYKLKLLFTTEGKQKHYFNYDEPHFLNSKIRFNTTLQYKYIPYENYFGIGNGSTFDENYTNQDSSDFINKRYYSYKLFHPMIDANFLFPIIEKFYLLTGFQFLYSDIDTYKKSLLSIDNATGIGVSRMSGLKSGLIIDTRDNEPAPSRGTFSEISAIFSESIFGSTYDVIRLVASTKNYLLIHKNLVYAFRVLFKTDFGGAPFYEFSQNGGYIPITGLGGEETLRGISQNRFIDRTHLLVNNEFRYDIVTILLDDHRFDSALILFLDAGRVYEGLSDFELNHPNFSGGFGLSVAWNKNFVIRGDIGFSQYEKGMYIGFGHIF